MSHTSPRVPGYFHLEVERIEALVSLLVYKLRILDALVVRVHDGAVIMTALLIGAAVVTLILIGSLRWLYRR
jgi:hypothetical protein